MKKEFTGYLGGDCDDLGMFDNKKDAERGMFPSEELNDLLEEFKGKKVKLTVEEVDDIVITSDSGVSYPTTHYTEGISVSKNNIMLGDEDTEIQLRITKEDYNILKDRIEKNEATITVHADEIEQRVTKENFKSE